MRHFSASTCPRTKSAFLFLRLMILVFTSTAFTNFVKRYVALTDDTTFNPYLTMLFWAMYVLLIFICVWNPRLTTRVQGWHVCHAFPWLLPLPDLATNRPLSRGIRPWLLILYWYNRSQPCSIAGSLVHLCLLESAIVSYLGSQFFAQYTIGGHLDENQSSCLHVYNYKCGSKSYFR